MRTVSVRLADLAKTELYVGYVGENLHTRVIIDASKMFEQYPTAAVAMTVQPPFSEAYPAVVERQGNDVIWDVTDSDLIRQGNGEIQLAFTVDEIVAKTFVGRIRIGRSIIPTGEIPDPLDDFLTRAGAALTGIPQTIDNALAAAKASGEFDGKDGEDGYSPTATVTKSGKTATITITDKNGTTTETVSDGEDGAPGTTDYTELDNKPSIAGVTLSGNKSLDDFGAASKSDTVLNTTLSINRKAGSSVGTCSVAMGQNVEASGKYSHAENGGTTASGDYSHSEGGGTTASGGNAHSEGGGTTASGPNAHSEGGGTVASGAQSHAEGGATTASGSAAHSEGSGTIAKHYAQHAGGAFNVPDPSDAASTASGTYIEIIGNGSADNARSNARTLDWVGNEVLAGDLTVKKGTSDEINVSTLKNAIEGNASDITDLENGKAPIIFDTASGAIASFPDGADGLPVKQIAVQIDPVQSGSGDPAPDNVRPITGWTGANVGRVGINLWDEQWESGRLGYDKTQASWGQNVNSDTSIRSKNYVPVAPGTSYYCYSGTASTVYAVFYNRGKNPVPTSSNAGYQGISNQTFTAPSNAYYLRFYCVSTSSYSNDISINCLSTDTEYHAYVGNVYPISWQSVAGTVYGGTLTVNDDGTGTLVVDREIVDLGDISFSYVSDREIFYGNFSSYNAYKPQSATIPDILCSQYAKATAYNQNALLANNPDMSITFAVPSDAFNVVVKDSRYTDSTTFNSATNGIKLVYPLATPVSYPLTAEVISTLLGQNCIFADTGSVSVTYRADTELFVQKSIPVQDVQINGTSILNQGVANVPVAGVGQLGAVKLAQYYGLQMTQNNELITDPANSDNIKLGNNGYKPISTLRQHQAVFYGLAKCAGSDMASSSNPVGTFTNDAKIAIQKMLGIYESPWELIREDTVNNAEAGEYSITVDGNGNPFELTDVVLQVNIPSNTATVVGSYGTVQFYFNNSEYKSALLNAYSGPKSGRYFASAQVLRDGNAFRVLAATFSESGNNRMVQIRNDDDFVLSDYTFKKIKIVSVQGTLNYKLYGKRKWTA